MFEYIKMPYLEENGETGGSATEGAGSEAGSQIETSTAQKGESNGEAGQTPDGSKQSVAWAEMRKKAQLAEEYEKQLNEHKTKLDDYEKKIAKLQKGLPDGYSSLDEYLETLDEYLETLDDNYQEPREPAKPIVDEKLISTMTNKALESNPYIQKAKTFVEREEKRYANEFIVKNFSDLQKKFPEIKEAEDVPLEVLEAFMKNEVDGGQYKRSLLSYYYEIKGDELIENAKKQGVSHAKAQTMGVAHTGQVQGTNAKTEYDDVTVPDNVKASLMRNPVLRKAIEKDPSKLKYYYKKYHQE